jgi:D-apionolactonase
MPPEATEPEEADVHAAPEIAVPLRAGPLRLVFDRGELRWIRLGEREVLRGIYVAVREEGWSTVPAEIEDLAIEAEPESFRIRFRARHERGRVRFDWEGRVEGGADGRIVFRMAGAAGATFRRNRIGFCVLHPAEGCAGRECIVETTDGDRLEQGFPALVSPHQPFRNVRAILHEVSPGVEVEVRMAGETFETEDQRNWSDASFKTYGTPLHLPYPVQIAEGTRVEQSVSVSLFGVTAAPVRQAAATVPGALPKKRNSTEPVVVRVGAGKGVALPSIGLGGASLAALSGAEAALLRPLRAAHLRADLRLDGPGWEGALETAVGNAGRVDAPLELAVLLPDDPRGALCDLAARAADLRARVASCLVFRAGDRTTAEGDVDLARAALSGIWSGALFGGGSDAHYAELNRRRAAVRGADRVVFAISPQVHAFDDATLFENTASLGAMATTIRTFCGEASLGISPITLRPREDPRPASAREPGERPLTDDPRQGTALAAAWTLALVSAAAEAGFASLTFFELRGPRGVMAGERPLPVLEALADLAALPGARVAPARSRRPERVRALALRRGEITRVFLANLTADPHPVRLEGLSGTRRRVAAGRPGPGVAVEGDVDLAPHEIVRVEAGPGDA